MGRGGTGHQSPKRSARLATQKADRQRRVGQLAISGVTQREIARTLGVSESVISLDLKSVRAEWHESARQDVATFTAREVVKLDRDEQALRARLAAIAPMVDGKLAKGADVDAYARVYDRVLRIMERRARLLGLDAPVRVDAQIEGQIAVEVQRVNVVAFAADPRAVDLASQLLGRLAQSRAAHAGGPAGSGNGTHVRVVETPRLSQPGDPAGVHDARLTRDREPPAAPR